MRNNGWLLGVCVVAAAAAWLLTARSAGGEEADGTSVLLPQKSVNEIYQQLESIRRQQDELTGVAEKLDQVLKNQETILSELNVVKMRVSRR